MTFVANATQFGVTSILSADRDGRDLVLALLNARFRLPGPRDDARTSLIDNEQAGPPLADIFWDDVEQPSLRSEGQNCFTRPATDIYVTGSVRTLDECAVQEHRCGIRAGTRQVEMCVVGDRIWWHSARGSLESSDPEPFSILPIRWERAVGGVEPGEDGTGRPLDDRNTVGVGLHIDEIDARGKSLPNFEHPTQRLRSPLDRPPPVGLGPVARHWQPRLSFAGTYDEAWKKNRAPLWPNDLDERFFCAAVENLQIVPHLNGGERIELFGFHPDGALNFEVPSVRPLVVTRFRDRADRRHLILDALTIDTDNMTVDLTYRAAVPAGRDLAGIRECYVRVLEAWEQ